MGLVFGHDEVKDFFVRAKGGNRLSHCYLLHGRESIGKKLLAMETGRMLRCLDNSNYNPCTCASCTNEQTGNGSGFENVLVEQGDLCMDLVSNSINRHAQMSVGAGANNWRVIVIENIHLANKETANALLKTLEEPGKGTIMILTTSSLDRVLPTIVSRSTLVAMKPLPQGVILQIYDQLDGDNPASTLQQQLRQELYDGTVNTQKIDADTYFKASQIVDTIFNNPDEGTKQMLKLLWKLDDKALFHDICIATYKKTLDKYYKNIEYVNILMFADHILSLLDRCEFNINLETVKLDFLSKLALLAKELPQQRETL